MNLRERYAARSIRFLEPWACAGWRIKLYGLAYRRVGPEPGLVEAAKRRVAACLPRPAITEQHYGVGFMGVHQGRDANLAFIGWWARENELYHHAWVATPDAPESFEYVTPQGLAACVWDLAVIAFERQAWIDTVLAAPVPSLERYLEMHFEGHM